MKKKKWLYYTISFLTGFVVFFFALLQQEGALQKLIDNPALMIVSIVASLAWAALLLGTTIALLIKGEWREESFLLFAGANANDELEQEAVNDAIKRTFLINLLILVSVVVLSGFTYTKFEDSSVDKRLSFSYRLMNDYSDLNESLEKFDKIEPKSEQIKEGLKEIKKLQTGTHYYLIPKIFFSPYGVLIFILLQFMTFRIFLFFNRRKFL